MEVYEALPQPLKSKFGQDIPQHVQHRLHYQWKLIHRFAKSVLPMSHRTSRAFVDLCNIYGVELPSYVINRLCPWCSVILLPTVTCSTKLRKRTRRSQVNLRSNKKLRNEVVYHCLRCEHKSFHEPGAHQTTRKESLKMSTSNDEMLSKTQKKTEVTKSNFSFLRQLDKKMSTSGNAFNRNDSDGFMAFSAAPEVKSNTPNSTTGTPNLLELEAMKKKKKRKSLTSIDDDKWSGKRTKSSSNTSLGSLQQMLQKRS